MSRNLQTGTFHFNIFGAINSLQTFIGVIIWALNDRIWSTSSIDSVFFFFLREMLRLQQFYNIFTTNHGWLVIIGSSLNLVLKLLF